MRLTARLAVVVIALACLVPPAGAAEQAAARPIVVLEGLANPCGVAVQPGTGHVFVSDSAALRVMRYITGRSSRPEAAITGFPKDVYGKGPMYDIGPLGLAFLDRDTLVVGGGGLPDGQELLRIYTVPVPGRTISADKMKYKLGPLGPSDQTIMGEGNFYGIVVTDRGIFVTCNGDDTKGWVSKVSLSGGTPGKYALFIATKVATEVDAPVGITADKSGNLVVGQMGEINVPQDSLLTVYSADSGEMLSNAETDLFDITALAYSPKSGKLYALDFAWMDTKQGGLFRLDVTGTGEDTQVEAVKLAGLDKPTAMAFAPDGTLYVTVFGTAAAGSSTRPGKLLKVTGDL